MRKAGKIVFNLAVIASGILLFVQCTQEQDGATSSQTVSEDFNTWREFKPRSELFKVLFPHTPQYAKDYVPIPGSETKRRYDMYASEKIDGTLFLISVITYPKEADISDKTEILKQTVEELMRTKPDNQLKKLNASVFKTFPAVDFSIVNQNFHVEGKAFMKNDVVYVLSYVTRKEHFNSDEFQHYINSFELLNENPESNATENPESHAEG